MELQDVVPGSDEFTTTDGRTWRLAPLKLKILAELKRRFLAEVPDPIVTARELCKDQPEEVQKHLLGMAFSEVAKGWRADPELFEKWLSSGEGQRLAYVLRIQANHPNLSEAECEVVLDTYESARLSEPGNELSQPSGPAIGAGSSSDSPNPAVTPLESAS